MTDEALYTRSQLHFDGTAISVAENAEDLEREESEADRKTAIHSALTDIENELHPEEAKKKEQEKASAAKDEKKAADEKKKPAKDEPKK